jgi:hypothetical protein
LWRTSNSCHDSSLSVFILGVSRRGTHRAPTLFYAPNLQ